MAYLALDSDSGSSLGGKNLLAIKSMQKIKRSSLCVQILMPGI